MRNFGYIAAILSLALAGRAADTRVPVELEGVQITEHLGEKIDLNLEFVDESGMVKPLRTYFQSGRPVVLNLVYYTCPMLCKRVLAGQVATMRAVDFTPGKEYEVVTVSIDPTETFEIAREKRSAWLASFGRPAPGWHFLADYNGNSRRLAEQVGFGYKFDERSKQYAHTATIMVLTPQGKVSRYLYGLLEEKKARDFRFALVEAAAERFGITDRVLMWCFHYDPNARSYVLFARNFMKIGGALVLGLLGWFLARMWRQDAHKGFGKSVPESLVSAK